jgi:DNA mismatch endonuclease, patch repair protein
VVAFKFNPTPERSHAMASVGQKNTTPELLVRRALHKLGYRFRIHVHELPGCPDVVLPSRGVILQVKGCFWHGHSCSRGKNLPKTNSAYWIPKLARNHQRDTANERRLRRMGWSVHSLWECKLGKYSPEELDRVLHRILQS